MGASAQEIRDEAMYRQYVILRWSAQRIAEHHDVSVGMVHAGVKRMRDSLPEIDRSAIVKDTVESLRDLAERVMEIAELPPAPAFDQKGGLLYGPDGEVVLDYGTRLKAIAEARALDASLGKRLGLDAPTKQEIEHSGGVQYQVIGVDPTAMQ